MKLRHLFAIALLPLVVACGKSPDTAQKPADPVAQQTAKAAPQPAETQKATSEPQATESATPPPAKEANPLGAGAPLLAASLTEGKDYEFIPNGAPFDTPAGQVEVAELFNYACPACNSFNPKLEQWKKTLPAYAHVVFIPMDFRPDFVAYAHAFYAAQAFGLVEQTHDAVYNAIHVDHTLPGEGKPQDSGTIAKFYAKYGVDADKFQQMMDSFAVSAKTAKARQFGMDSHIHGTPSLVINGQYLVKGSNWDNMLHNASVLIEAAYSQQ